MVDYRCNYNYIHMILKLKVNGSSTIAYLCVNNIFIKSYSLYVQIKRMCIC